MASNVGQSENAQSGGPNSMPDLNGAIIQPATKAGQQVYETIAGGLQWYAEQWEDLYHEARASLVRQDTAVEVSDVLAGLGDATVTTDIPGRVRLRLAHLRGHDHLAIDTAEAVRRMPGVTRVDINSLTGSILILYETQAYATRDALLSRLTAAH